MPGSQIGYDATPSRMRMLDNPYYGLPYIGGMGGGYAAESTGGGVGGNILSVLNGLSTGYQANQAQQAKIRATPSLQDYAAITGYKAPAGEDLSRFPTTPDNIRDAMDAAAAAQSDGGYGTLPDIFAMAGRKFPKELVDEYGNKPLSGKDTITVLDALAKLSQQGQTSGDTLAFKRWAYENGFGPKGSGAKGGFALDSKDAQRLEGIAAQLDAMKGAMDEGLKNNLYDPGMGNTLAQATIQSGAPSSPLLGSLASMALPKGAQGSEARWKDAITALAGTLTGGVGRTQLIEELLKNKPVVGGGKDKAIETYNALLGTAQSRADALVKEAAITRGPEYAAALKQKFDAMFGQYRMGDNGASVSNRESPDITTHAEDTTPVDTDVAPPNQGVGGGTDYSHLWTAPAAGAQPAGQAPKDYSHLWR